jgi:hypothetical protein
VRPTVSCVPAAPADGDAGYFGSAVGVSGNTAGVGAPVRPTGGQTNAGAAYVFLLDPAPVITSFTPMSGPPGTPVFISGTGFATLTGVTFNGAAAANYSTSAGTQITATVPVGATSGPIAVFTSGGVATSPTDFTVTAPKAKITNLKPAAGKRGATVVITGSLFGDKRRMSTVQFGAHPCATYVSWNSTEIRCKVPATAKFGAVQVTVKTLVGTSNAVSFTVRH